MCKCASLPTAWLSRFARLVSTLQIYKSCGLQLKYSVSTHVLSVTVYAQGDEARAVFKFTPLIAPVKATVFPLLQKQQLIDPASALSQQLTAVGLSNIIDSTGGSLRGGCKLV